MGPVPPDDFVDKFVPMTKPGPDCSELDWEDFIQAEMDKEKKIMCKLFVSLILCLCQPGYVENELQRLQTRIVWLRMGDLYSLTLIAALTPTVRAFALTSAFIPQDAP